MYKVIVNTNTNSTNIDERDSESYLFNRLPILVDRNNNLYKELIDQTVKDYLSVPPYKVIELPKMFIIGDSVKIYVYENDSVELRFEECH